MQRPSRKRTTLTPGVVDLPRARRTSAEVALEKQKKDSAATKKAEAKRQAEIRVAELEKQVAVAQNEARNASKRPRKQPAMIVERDVSSYPIIDQISRSPGHALQAPAASSSSGPTAGKKRKADEQPTAMVIKKKGRPRYVPEHRCVDFMSLTQVREQIVCSRKAQRLQQPSCPRPPHP